MQQAALGKLDGFRVIVAGNQYPVIGEQIEKFAEQGADFVDVLEHVRVIQFQRGQHDHFRLQAQEHPVVFVGQVVETYCDERILTDGAVDLARMQPLLFSMNDRSYWTVGERYARAWDVGKSLRESR